MIPLSVNSQIAAQKTIKNPNLVLTIEGIDEIYGSSEILKIIQIGDPGLFIDGSWVIGGSAPVDGQFPYVSLDGSSTSIRQQLDYDKGRGSSIQSLDVELIDVRGKITELITPGLVVPDILGRKVKILLAIDGPSARYPDDYAILFRGIVNDIRSNPASVILSVSHPEQKKKQDLYQKIDTALTAGITNSATTIPVASTAGFLLGVAGPDGSFDPSFKSYVRIDDEIIEYTGISANNLTGCVRSQLSTFAVSHDLDAEVSSFYRLRDTAMDLALKVMLSKQGNFLEGITVSSFNIIPSVGTIQDSIFFEGLDVSIEYGLTIGDWVTTVASAFGANNVTLKEISSIERTDTGSYITVSGVTFTDESDSPATISFRSKYDTLPSGLGLGADEVDVTQHEFLRTQYLSSFMYDFYLKETMENAREWLDLEIYKPASAYSVPRKGQCSAQMLIGPIPGSKVTIFDESNIISPSRIRLRRSLSKNFYNTIVYKIEEDELEDKFLRGRVTQSATSLAQVKVGSRSLLIESRGLRVIDLGLSLAQAASTRRLRRYEFGAEYFEGISVKFGDGFDVELGDVVIFDPTNLNVSNTVDGDRKKPPALFEVANKSMNYRTGETTIDLVDTSFDENARYGLIGPSSLIKTGISQTQFVIEPSFGKKFGAAEYQKWKRYKNCAVRVRSEDGVTRYFETKIVISDSNTITVDDPLGFTPIAGDILELAPYDKANDQIKLIYVHLSPLTGADPSYIML